MSVVVALVGVAIHNLCNAMSFAFWAAHNELTQGKFTKRLVTGELTYEQAVAAYAEVNKERKAVASALWVLTTGHAPNQRLVTSGGGIEPLVELLVIATPAAQTQASGALASVSLDSPAARAEVAHMLVEVLLSAASRDETRRAASAIASLSREHASYREALAEAGASR